MMPLIGGMLFLTKFDPPAISIRLLAVKTRSTDSYLEYFTE
jgi:hypothetical protein